MLGFSPRDDLRDDLAHHRPAGDAEVAVAEGEVRVARIPAPGPAPAAHPETTADRRPTASRSRASAPGTSSCAWRFSSSARLQSGCESTPANSAVPATRSPMFIGAQANERSRLVTVTLRHHVRVHHRDVIAALGFERDIDAELALHSSREPMPAAITRRSTGSTLSFDHHRPARDCRRSGRTSPSRARSWRRCVTASLREDVSRAGADSSRGRCRAAAGRSCRSARAWARPRALRLRVERDGLDARRLAHELRELASPSRSPRARRRRAGRSGRSAPRPSVPRVSAVVRLERAAVQLAHRARGLERVLHLALLRRGEEPGQHLEEIAGADLERAILGSGASPAASLRMPGMR